jgi:hypothetical protein
MCVSVRARETKGERENDKQQSEWRKVQTINCLTGILKFLFLQLKF